MHRTGKIGHALTQFTWTKLISDQAKCGQGREALTQYKKMREEGVLPNHLTFLAALKACSTIADLKAGKIIHGHITKCGYQKDIYVASTVVDMYAKCGSIQNARLVFDTMTYRNVVSWNAMITGYAHMSMWDPALQLFSQMQDEGFIPDARTFVAALKACSSLVAEEDDKGVDCKHLKAKCLEHGRAIHFQLANRGFELDVFIASTLIDLYSKCGCIDDARHVFDKMQVRTAVNWTAMIAGYAHMELGNLALGLYEHMQREGFTPTSRTFIAVIKACGSLAVQGGDGDELVKKGYLEQGRAIHAELSKGGFDSDIFVASTLVDMYAKCGSLENARQAFENVKDRDVVLWNAMINGYVQMERGDLALKLYECMQREGFTPVARTFVAALKACGSLASLEAGKNIHSQINKVGLKDHLFIASCLVDMYGKCGSMMDAHQLFDSLILRDSVTWNALIAGYNGQGDSECTLDLYERMQQEGINPDGTTFVSLLSVCSHDGLVEKGQTYFQAMCMKYRISPSNKHYRCMADLLGRAGQLDEAVTMVKKMPVKPDMVMWMTILAACRKWNNMDVGRNAFECSVMLDEKFVAAYVLMTNIYTSAQMWEERAAIQEMRMKVQAWKKPGHCMWTDGAGIVHTFIVGERNHPQSKEIYAKLKDFSVRMREEFFIPDSDISPNISDDDEHDVLCGHCEKLAIACALINTLPGTSIRIVKNLQVCVECHKTIVLISKIEHRTIFCRDANRFHVFKDGKCSCGDF